MKYFKLFSLAALLLIGSSAIAQEKKEHKMKDHDKSMADDHRKNHDKLMADAEDAKAKLIAEDPSMAGHFDEAAGYVIFPNVGKGALIIGGASGHGILYEGETVAGMAKLKKLSIGLQAGGQAIIEAVLFETQEALNEFKEGEFEFAAGVSAVVLKEGKAKNIEYEDGIAVVALPKAGLMAEASVGGQKFSYHEIN